MKFATRAIHSGQEPDQLTGAVNTPVYLSSTFKQDAIGKMRGGWEYSRSGNPTRASLETTIASLENGKYGLCFSSGSAASAAVFGLLKPGDEVVSTVDIYGGTYRLLRHVFENYGIRPTFLFTSDASDILEAVRPETAMIWIETPSNPLLNIIDIQALAQSKNKDTILVIDNTFATPFFQSPLDLGADIVVHSATKYLGGHSDIIGGAVVTNDNVHYGSMKFLQNAVGAILSPMECFLIQRALKTLEIRMKQHEKNAFAVAMFLNGHPQVERVFFPALEDHPNHRIAKKQMRGFSGMVSCILKGGRPAVDRFLSGIRIFMLAESLGGVESLVCYPFDMTHSAIPAEDKKRIGITESLIRLSVGIEDIEDLLEDLDQALNFL